MRKLLVHLIACSLVLGSSSRLAHAADCDFEIPTPPNPVPPGFNWTPLAQDFCAQLASCGLGDPSCMSNYLSAVASFPAPPGGGSEGFDSAGTSDALVCEDSDEYARGETTCCAPSCSGKACGADDGCGHSCCLQCTSCFPVSCGVCQVADACGASCSPAPDGSPCGFGSGGGFCEAGVCTTGPSLDASVPDARVTDARVTDARVTDASITDAPGPGSDASSDARVTDAPGSDARVMDAPGPGSDASSDARSDAGSGSDAGPHFDASVLDARGSAFPHRE